MIDYNYIGSFDLKDPIKVGDWLQFVLDEEEKELGEVNYIFCDDDYLHDININQLKHNTLTDIISLDYTVGNVVSGDIYISYDRVKENAVSLNVSFEEEIHRVMVHGILHYCGYKDKEESDKVIMRSKEDYYLSLRTF